MTLARLAIVLLVLAVPAAAVASPPALYVTSTDTNEIYQYTVDPADGTFAPMGAASVSAEDGPVRLATSPDKGTGAFLYAANVNDGQISQYTISGVTGELTSIAGLEDAGASASDVMVNPEGTSAYVVNPVLDSILRYPITGTGDLGTTTSNLGILDVEAIAMAPDGRTAYAGESGTVVILNVGAVDALSVRSSVTTGGGQVWDMHMNARGTELYVLTTNQKLWVYAVDAGSGDLTVIDQDDATAGDQPFDLAGAPVGGCTAGGVSSTLGSPTDAVYVGCPTQNKIVSFCVCSGALDHKENITATGAVDFTASRHGDHLYVARTSGDVELRTINGDGTLVDPPGDTDAGPTNSLDIVLSPGPPLAAPSASFDPYPADPGEPSALDGRATSGADGAEFFRWDIDTDQGAGAAFTRFGVTAPNIQPTFASAGTYTVRLTALARQLYDGRSTQQYATPSTVDQQDVVVPAAAAPPTAPGDAPAVYVIGGTDVAQFGEAADGRLVAKSPATVGGLTTGIAGASSPDGRFLYVLDNNATIATFSIASDGRLTAVGPAVATGANPRFIAVSPDGRSIYATSNGDTAIRQYDVGADGRPVPKSPADVDVPGATTVSGVAIDQSGRALFAGADTGVARFSIAADGRLSYLGDAAGPTLTQELRVHPNGGSLYAVNFGGQVFQYDIGAGGSLTPKVPAFVSIPNSCQPSGGTPSADGAFFYATCLNPGGFTRDVAQWSIDGSGRLNPLTPAYTVLGMFTSFAPAPNLSGSALYVPTSISRQLDVAPGGAVSPASPSVIPGGVSGQAIVTRSRSMVTAAFTAAPGAAGSATRFDASGSSAASAASVARYDWDFGDGTTLANGGPTPTHTYAAAGAYAPRLTVFADDGNRTVYFGTTMLRDGDASTGTTVNVAAAPGPPVVAPPSPAPPNPPPRQVPPVAPPPVKGKTLQAQPVRGKVTVTLPGGRVVPLESLRSIPVGSIVDATRGRVRITAEVRRGGFETCDFYDGRFRLRQGGGAAATVDAQLLAPPATSRPRAVAAAAAQKKRRAASRKLWGDGKGKFRIIGKHSSAAIRGTQWLVQETAEGTLTRVTRGVVTVRDVVRDRTVIVRAGGRYLARARASRRRR